MQGTGLFLLLKVFKPAAPDILRNGTVLRAVHMRAEDIADVWRQKTVELNLKDQFVVINSRNCRHIRIEDILG